MSDLKDILREEYEKSIAELMDPHALMTMIEEALAATATSPEIIQEMARTATGENIEDLLPVLKITEDWGKLGKRDRSIIENFTAQLGGEETSIAEKIINLNEIIAGNDPATTIAEILTTMMVVEVLSSILDEFTEPAGGFIFEGFIAGLFGGKSIQIEKPEDITAATGQKVSAKGKPITDVILAGRHYSLKLLGPTTAVAGSFQNMVNHFETVDHVTYLDARREGDDLHFSEFDITLPTFLDTFYWPHVRREDKKQGGLNLTKLHNRVEKMGDKIYAIKLSRPLHGKTVVSRMAKGSAGTLEPNPLWEEFFSLENIDEYGPFEIRYLAEKFSGKVKDYYGSQATLKAVQDAVKLHREFPGPENDQKVLDALRETPAFKKPLQFAITRDQTSLITSYRDLGTLRLGDSALQQTWMNYGQRLMPTIAPVYRALNSFTSNINSYFLSPPTKTSSRTEYGKQAIGDAAELRENTDQVVGTMEKESTHK